MSKRAAVAWAVPALLLVPAGSLTLVRLSDPAAGLLVQVQAFTPFALVPYALAVAVLGVLLARRSTRRLLPVAGTVPVGALVVVPAVVAVVVAGALHVSWLLPSYAGEGRAPAPAAGPADEVVVLSTNLYFGRGDGAAVVREVAAREVDVLVVSEVTRSSLAAMEAAGLDDLLPHRTGRPGRTYEGTMVFSGEPFESAGLVPGTRFDNLLVRTGGLDLLAAHPAAPLDPGAWAEDHAVLREVVTDQRPDVVVGDLNATLDHGPVRALVAAGYRDSAELLNTGLTTTWPVNGFFPVLGLLPPTAAIDHLLLAPGWTATSTATVEVPRTDHLAIVATVLPAA